MNKLCGWILTFLLILLVTPVSDAQAEFSTGPDLAPQTEWVADELLVKFKPGVGDPVIEKVNSRFKVTKKAHSKPGQFMRLQIPAKGRVAELVAAYRQQPEVAYAEPNYLAKAHAIPTDPYYSYQWNLDNAAYGGIHMEGAWGISSGDPNIIVAVIDTGVAYENYQEESVVRRRTTVVTYTQAPDLADTYFVPGYDFVNNDAHPNDDAGHGTHVTGTIAQSTNNGTGVAGIAYGTAIMPIKVLDSSGSGSYAAIAEGIYFAADNGAKVINMSLGGGSGSITLENALSYAHGKGVTIVCSSGNDGDPDTVGYPAAYDAYCIAVGATRYDETVSYYSNGGASLDITAPGGDLNVDQNGDGYVDGVLQQTFGSSPTDFGYYFYQGTSMAAPHVSGVAALLIASGVATSPDQVREALQATAEDHGAPGWDPAYGWGLLDAAAALNYSAVPNSPPVAVAGGPYVGTENQLVSFDGTASYDPEDGTLTYIWDFGDGANGSGSNPTHSYLAGGVYTVTLVVNDGLEASSPATTTATIVEVPDGAPVAIIHGPYSGTEGSLVTFDATGSYDPEGAPLSYRWDFGDGATGTTLSPNHTYASSGVYTVSLIVNDGALDSTVAVTKASIAALNVAPVAAAGSDLAATTGTSIVFNASGSYDPDGVLVSYDWDFGDGATTSGVEGAHVYGSAGEYPVTLTVTDNQGATGSDQLTVSVTESAVQSMHVAAIDLSLNVDARRKVTRVLAEATIAIVDADNLPVPGVVVTGIWSGATSGSDTAVTGGDGKVTLISNRVKDPSSETPFVLTIDSVSLAGWSYNPTDNVETSDTIIVP